MGHGDALQVEEKLVEGPARGGVAVREEGVRRAEGDDATTARAQDGARRRYADWRRELWDERLPATLRRLKQRRLPRRPARCGSRGQTEAAQDSGVSRSRHWERCVQENNEAPESSH